MDCVQPKWILDRRGSGCLFWRREKECQKQVRFRCDVEVLEFLPVEEEEIEAPSALAAAISLLLIAATVSYQWFL